MSSLLAAQDAPDPVKSFSIQRGYKRFARGEIPCARESLLMGLGTGFAISAVGLVARRGIKTSLNWGMGAFVVSSIAKHLSCMQNRKLEAARMRVVVEDYKRKSKSKQSLISKDDSPISEQATGASSTTTSS